MAFYATNFIYDSIISSEYGLRITSTGDDNGDGADVELYTEKIYRRPKVYLLGVSQTPVLSIPIHISVPDQLSTTESSVISKWLFGRMTYKKLQILQPDMQYVYYNCIFTAPKIERIGNIIRGYDSTIICDSPFAWCYPKSTTYTYTGGGYTVNEYLDINNNSDNDDYTYPTIAFTMNVFGGGISIINESDSDREFLFTGLSPNQLVTVDNDLQILTSSTLESNLTHFNYKWLRYVPKINSLHITGNITSMTLTHQFAKKIS